MQFQLSLEIAIDITTNMIWPINIQIFYVALTCKSYTIILINFSDNIFGIILHCSNTI